MSFIAICLHCLDMRDFHSHMRDTPFLDVTGPPLVRFLMPAIEQARSRKHKHKCNDLGTAGTMAGGGTV